MYDDIMVQLDIIHGLTAPSWYRLQALGRT
jgi:hypothetical protein